MSIKNVSSVVDVAIRRMGDDKGDSNQSDLERIEKEVDKRPTD